MSRGGGVPGEPTPHPGGPLRSPPGQDRRFPLLLHLIRPHVAYTAHTAPGRDGRGGNTQIGERILTSLMQPPNFISKETDPERGMASHKILHFMQRLGLEA